MYLNPVNSFWMIIIVSSDNFSVFYLHSDLVFDLEDGSFKQSALDLLGYAINIVVNIVNDMMESEADEIDCCFISMKKGVLPHVDSDLNLTISIDILVLNSPSFQL